ncbi:hypothetical protein LXA43DRAFT_973301 [Ganoderma leucocontextum]|nr:hypothetical protein LXA43DRAFT_973301 [Ganoderma leucocontextum]
MSSDFSSIGSTRSIMDMPLEGGKLAPKTFKGDPADVESFLRRFERLAILHHLTSQERCEMVTDYCGRIVRETIEGFKAYRDGNWETLKADIRKFRVKDLETFVIHTQKQNIYELRDWRKYLRNFIRVAGWLRGQSKLSDDDYAYYMWIGLHPRFRSRLENRILLEEPNHDMSEPFSPESIAKAAEAILGVERFDTERLSSDDGYLYASDEEDDGLPASLRKKRQPKTTRVIPDDSDDEDDGEKHKSPITRTLPHEAMRHKKDKQRNSPGDDEFDKLVDQMQALSLDDPKYGILFMKACKLNPLAADCLRRPMVNRERVAHMPTQDTRRELPPHMRQPNPNRFISQRGPPLRDGCYGCGNPGHIMRDCMKMQELLDKHIVLKDYRGRFTHPDGMPIHRIPGETLIQAVKRVHPEVHLITYGGQLSPVQEEDEQFADVIVYPVERSQRETRSYRKQVSDGPRSQASYQDKGKQAEARPSQKRAYSPAPFPVTKPTPVEIQPRSFNPDNDTEMIDGTATARRAKPSVPTTAQPADKPRATNRSSQISKDVDPGAILEKILDTSVTLPIRDVVGASKEVATCLQDAIKVKRVDFTQPIASNLVTKNKRDSLIHIEMKYKDTPVDFIVDTGSELNIISKEVYDMFEGLVINPAEAVTMRDANGGSSKLLGLVQEIPLKVGPIYTPIDAYVSTSPAFSGVLGRPWQREHHIGIEEREEGTFLTFPNEDECKAWNIAIIF